MSVNYVHDFRGEFLKLGKVEEFWEDASLVQSFLPVLGKKPKFDRKLHWRDANQAIVLF